MTGTGSICSFGELTLCVWVTPVTWLLVAVNSIVHPILSSIPTPNELKKTFIHENECFLFHNLEEGVRFMSIPQNVAFELMRVGYWV